MPIQFNVEATQHDGVNGPIIVGSHSNTPVPHTRLLPPP